MCVLSQIRSRVDLSEPCMVVVYVEEFLYTEVGLGEM